MSARYLRTLIGACAATTASVLLASGTSGNHKPDGTNVWIGAASGGSMKEASNWKAVIGGVEYTDAAKVTELFQKHVALDLRSLENGAVLLNDITLGNTYKERDSGTYTMLAGLIVGGAEGETRTIRQSGGKGFFPCAPCNVTVTGGTFNWDDTVSGSYPYKNLRKNGDGRLRFVKAPFFWENTLYVYEGTIAFTNGASSGNARWSLDDGTRLEVEKGVTTIAQVYSGQLNGKSAELHINDDATLKYGSGFNSIRVPNTSFFYGDLTGGGTLQVTGGAEHQFRRGNTNPLSFTGTYQAHLGELIFGKAGEPVGINPAAKLDVDGTGSLRFFDDVTACELSGKGADGSVIIPEGKTLTVTGPASGEAESKFNARIAGGSFVKQGANYNLVMSGANIYKGETRIEAGKLSIKRTGSRKGLRAYWDFEDADDLGADASPDGILRLAVKSETVTNFVAPRQIEDGVVGRAVHFGDGNSLYKGGKLIRGVGTNSLSAAATLPRGSMPFTFSFWMRPTKGKCGNGTNFIHINSPSTNSVTTVDGETAYGLNWGDRGFFFGSTKFDEGETATSATAFKNLCFYCGVGWTRGGAWDDKGSSKTNVNKVAIAKFDDPNYLFDGKWHHVVGTYSNRVMRIFVDGVKMDERTRSADINVTSDPYMELGNYSAGDPAHCYQGGLDEIQWIAGAWSEEEVMAEYLAKKPATAGAMLPQPIAHWTFDEQNADYSFPDVTGNGYDLVSVATNNKDHVQTEAVSYAGDTSLTGKAAHNKEKGTYLKLKDGITFGDRLADGASFTLSMRGAGNHDGVIFSFGNDTDTNSVRLNASGTPRMHKWHVGTNNNTYYQLSDSGVFSDNGDIFQASYFFNTLVYDASRKTLKIYRDSTLMYVKDDLTFTLKPTSLQWGGTTTKYINNLRLDDLRIYDEALTEAQVAELARVVRHGGTIGDEAALAMPVIPSNSAVTVALGAVLEAKGRANHAVKSLAGAGDVKVCARSSFRAGDYTGFTGTIAGKGSLLVEEGQSLTLDPAQIAADVGFENDTIVVASATKDRPLVRTNGRVVLPKAGTLKLSDATSGDSFAGKRFLIAECASAVVPADLSGWSFEPATDNALAFKCVGNKLYASCSGGGTVIILR